MEHAKYADANTVQEYQQAVNNAQSQLAGGSARRRLIHHLGDFSNGKPSWESETT